MAGAALVAMAAAGVGVAATGFCWPGDTGVKTTVGAGAGAVSTGEGAGSTVGRGRVGADSAGVGRGISACGISLWAGATGFGVEEMGATLATATGLSGVVFVSDIVTPTETSTRAIAPRQSQSVFGETGSLGLFA